MKKIIFLILITVIVGVYADWTVISGPSQSAVPPEIKTLRSNNSGVLVRGAVFGFIEEDTTIDSKDFKHLEIPDGQLLQEYTNSTTSIAGKPQIPYIRLLIAVPDSATFSYEVRNTDFTRFDDYLVYPIPKIEFEVDSNGFMGSKEVYAYDTTFYNKDTLYPDKFYDVISDGYWRDQRVLEVFLYPVQCNPKHELVYFYHGLDLAIDYSGTVSQNTRGLGPFEDIGREILVNYPGVEIQSGTSPNPAVRYYSNLDTNNLADYIIVTHEDFLGSQYDSFWIHEFAEWRVDHNKFDVGVVKMNDIYSEFPPSQATDSAKSLREFLVYAYDNWKAPSMTDTHFAYCLLVGDWDYVPMETCLVEYRNTNPLTDDVWMNAYEGYFRDVDADTLNYLEDIMLGRWPAKATASPSDSSYYTRVLAKKTIDYEKTPQLNPDDWRRRGLLVAGGGSSENTFDRRVAEALPYFTDINYDTLTLRYLHYESLEVAIPMSDSLHKLLNYGEIIMAYYGHGGPYGWGVPDSGYYNYGFADTLENGGKLPAIFSYTCNIAMFQFDHPYYDTLIDPTRPNWWLRDTCFGECMLWNPDGGAVAFYGGTSPIYIGRYYNTRPIRRILRDQHWTVGKALINTTSNKKDNCFCLLGDPALDIGDYTAYPNLPDLVVRPRGIDISLLDPYPYPAAGDSFPIQAKILNIGGSTACSIGVYIDIVESDHDTVYSDTFVIDTILPRDTAVVSTYWKPDVGTYSYGEVDDFYFCAEADPNDDITESWEYNNQADMTKKLVLYPSESGWPVKVTGFFQPALADVNDTTHIEIVYPSKDSLYVFKNDGDVLIGWPRYFKDVYGVVLGNLYTATKGIEILAVSPESLKVYDYQGNVLSGWPKQIPDSLYDVGYRFDGLPALEFPFGSSIAEIIIAAKDTNRYAAHRVKILVYSYNGTELDEDSTTYGLDGYLNLNGPSIGDMLSGGGDETVISYGFTRGLEQTVDSFFTEIFNSTGLQSTQAYGNNRMTPALVDLDGDNYADMIVGDVNDTIRAYNAKGDSLIGDTLSVPGKIRSSPVVGDIEPEMMTQKDEIAFGNDSMEIWALDNRLGKLSDNWPVDVDGKVRMSAALANIDNSSGVDIIIGTGDDYMHAYDWETDSLTPYPIPLFGAITSGPTPLSPVIGEIDGDGKSEVIFSSYDGYLHAWENMNSSVSNYTLDWPQFHHDYNRSGLHNQVGGMGRGMGNPAEFSQSTTISFSLKAKLPIKVIIYDNEWKKVKTLVDQVLPKGKYNPVWYGKDDNYTLLPNGLYYIEFRVNSESKFIPVTIKR